MGYGMTNCTLSGCPRLSRPPLEGFGTCCSCVCSTPNFLGGPWAEPQAATACPAACCSSPLTHLFPCGPPSGQNRRELSSGQARAVTPVLGTDTPRVSQELCPWHWRLSLLCSSGLAASCCSPLGMMPPPGRRRCGIPGLPCTGSSLRHPPRHLENPDQLLCCRLRAPDLPLSHPEGCPRCFTRKDVRLNQVGNPPGAALARRPEFTPPSDLKPSPRPVPQLPTQVPAGTSAGPSWPVSVASQQSALALTLGLG